MARQDFTEAQQEAIYRKHAIRWADITLATNPIDKDTAKETIVACYKRAKLKVPQFVYVEGPRELKEAMIKVEPHLAADRQKLFTYFGAQLGPEQWGSRAAYKDALDELGEKFTAAEEERWKPWQDVVTHASIWWAFDTHCFYTNRPAEVHTQPRRPGSDELVLHNEDGPAILWRDGTTAWEIGGIEVTEKIVMRPGDLTKDDILNERNAELRRIMINRLGTERMAERLDLKFVHKDDFGELYRIEIPDDEDIFLCKVVNSTAKNEAAVLHADWLQRLAEGKNIYKDYSGYAEFENYWLRVKPSATAHEAVAASFHETPETYRPVVEG